MSVLDALKNQEILQIRRTIHQKPELAYHEFETAKFVADCLDDIGISTVTGVAKTGVVATVQTPMATQTLIIRAELDAQPITERTGLQFASIKGGMMHASGHDAHIAILLGAAKELVAKREQLNTNIKFVFQPAEGAGTGASDMISEGVLDGGVTGAIALHVSPDAEVGDILLRRGAALASSDFFEITLRGSGGDGAVAVQNSSISFVASQIVDNLYSVVPRKFHAADSSVISVCNIECGTTFDVMPSFAVIRGAIHSYDEEVRALTPVYIEQVVGCLSAAYDVTYETKFTKGAPTVINDAVMASKVEQVAREVGELIELPRPSMMSDDFAYFAHRVPSCYVGLGCTSKGKKAHPLHSESFDIDENCMQVGVDFLVKFALNYS